MPAARRKPADRRPAKTALFAFTGADGKKHTLPLASVGAEKLSGRALRDAFMDGDSGQLKLGFAMLEACGAPQAVIDTLYDLPGPACMEILGDWMNYGDGAGSSVPQSSSSST
jgi:hypothetical protein